MIVALPEHRLLDRLVRGRLWIGLLAFALIGIVAMQLLVLKLNTGIGRELQRSAQLQRENADLSIENSTAAAGENIEPQASSRGMQIAPAGAIHFLYAGPSDAAAAASRLRHWNPAPSVPSSTSTGETSASAPTTAPEQPTQQAPAPALATQTSSSEPASETGSTTSSSQSTEASAPAPAESPAQPAGGSEAQASANPAAAQGGGTQAQG